MKRTHIRNATMLIEFDSAGQYIGLLANPVLSQRGALPFLPCPGKRRQCNPLVGLPTAWPALSKRVTHRLMTHRQRGHVDHLDGPVRRLWRGAELPVFCMARDTGSPNERPGEPSVYLAGDTVLTAALRRALAERTRAVAVLPAGEARCEAIPMDGAAAIAASALTAGVVIAKHLAELNCFPTIRARPAFGAATAGLSHRLSVPRDAQTLELLA